jgi:cysteine-rich repeat protein
MLNLFIKKILIAIILFLVIFLLPQFITAATISPDAIAARVIPNPDHLSPLRWYQTNIKTQGSPQALLVDGYEAVRDGRTVYISSANIDTANNKFYTNIYLLSYDQNVEQSTVDIFGQILSHWKFNTNVPEELKDKVRNDTKRLADLVEIESDLDNYQKTHNNDFPDLTAGSYVSGKTTSKWPSWQATLSKELGITLPVDPINEMGSCPSGYDAETCWDQKNKSFYNPDPNNELPAGSHAYVYSYANGAYHACAVMESGYITDLAQGACSGSATGHSVQAPYLAPTINCVTIKGESNKPFSGQLSLSGSNAAKFKYWTIRPIQPSSWGSWLSDDMWQWKSGSNGLAISLGGVLPKLLADKAGRRGDYIIEISVANDVAGKEVASSTKQCLISVSAKTYCGDGQIQNPNAEGFNGPADDGREACDNGTANTNTPCTPTYAGSSCNYCDSICRSQTVPAPYCGDGNVGGGSETCDSSRTNVPCVPSLNSTCDYCDLNCHTQTVSPVCGDGRINKTGEVCDNGTANTNTACTPGFDSPCNYCDLNCHTQTVSPICGDGRINKTGEVCDNGTALNVPCLPGYNSGLSCSYCDSNCQEKTAPAPYCGDGTVNGGTETCDNGTALNIPCTPVYGSGLSCSYCDSNCHSQTVPAPFCGDGVKNGSEVCDDGNSSNGDGCSSACVFENRQMNCVSKPTGTDWNTSSTVLQTWNGSVWQPSNLSSYNITAGICKFKCQTGYSWNGSSCISNCTPTQKTQVYTAITAGTSFTVPLGVTSIQVKAWGAGGGGGGNDENGPAGNGGGGAYAVKTISVIPGQIITTMVGGGGSGGLPCSTSSGGGTGGINGGANGGNAGPSGCSGGGGAGGGFSGVYNSSTPLVIAGGGGGGGGGSWNAGASAGGAGGTNGEGNGGGIAGASGSTTGGKGGSYIPDGGGGGGGGGGYNGGNGGSGNPDNVVGGAGGGGGNSLGDLIVKGSKINVGNSGDANYAGSAGMGGVLGSGVGNSGRVVFIYVVSCP